MEVGYTNKSNCLCLVSHTSTVSMNNCVETSRGPKRGTWRPASSEDLVT